MKQINCKIIGLTGGIATGKSTVTKIIKENGYKVIDADKIAKDIVEKDKPAYNEVVEKFGEKILEKDKSINRKKLGNIIFKDRLLREELNNMLHPYIFKEIKDMIIKHSQNNEYIFVDIPLLIEEIDKFKEYEICFDEIWLVYIDEKTQLSRLMKRDLIGEERGIEKIRSQMSIDLKKRYATKIIDNRGDLKTLKKQMNKIMDEII